MRDTFHVKDLDHSIIENAIRTRKFAEFLQFLRVQRSNVFGIDSAGGINIGAETGQVRREPLIGYDEFYIMLSDQL
jgi:hypothetical protein